MTDSVELLCHPTTVNPSVRTIHATVERSAAGILYLRFRLAGAVSRLRIPPPAPARMASRLWEHTCFEAFLSIDGEPAYHELNFSPSSEWAAHAFRDYRDGGPIKDAALAPRIACLAGEDHLEVDCRLPLAALSEAHVRAPLRLGLSAVVEASDGALSYWALAHAPGRPDFHRRETFRLVLEQKRGQSTFPD